MEWSVIDLTLKQFGFPWTDEWQGTKFDYILHMVQDEDDDLLTNLGVHLGYDAGRVTPRVEPSFWRPNAFRLFVSHLADQKAYAAELQEALAPHGISAFIAHRDIEPAKEWQSEILLALSSADALVALLHPGFHESRWTDQEVGFAMGREILVLTIHLGETPYGFLGRHQALNGAKEEAETLGEELRRILIAHKLTSRRMAIAAAHAFAGASSFAEAKKLLAGLQEVKYWDRRMTDVVRGAVNGNGQVANAWGVPEGVEALLEKHGQASV